MDSIRVGDIAELLGVTAPTVRAMSEGLGTRTGGGHRRFKPTEVTEIAARCGITPTVEGLTATEVKVLAAVARSPRGLRSARAVARRAGVSPTAASRSLAALAAAGLIEQVAERRAEGKVVDVELWRIRFGDEWREVSRQVLRTVPPRPDRETVVSDGPSRLPVRFGHLFWSGNPNSIRLDRDAVFVARRMIGSGDLEAAAWAVTHLPNSAVREAAQARGWAPEDRALATNAANHG